MRGMRGRVAIVALLFFSAVSAFGDTAKEALEKEYKGRIVQFRQPVCGPEVYFDAAGNISGKAELDSWTICGRLRVEEITEGHGQIVLTGQRLFFVYSPRLQSMVDIDSFYGRSLSKETRDEINDRRKVIVFVRAEIVEPEQALKAIQRIIAKEDEFDSLLPETWNDAFSDTRRIDPPLKQTIYKVGNGVKAPKLLYNGDPEYTDIARRVKFQGVVLLTVIVGESGSADVIRIHHPLGLGLDEAAVAAVRRWKFQPAEKDGNPVAVQVSIEVSFRLY